MRLLRLISLVLVLLVAVSCAKKQAVKQAQQGPYDPEETFRRANELVERKFYNDARREFELIKGRDNTLKYAPLAHLRVADTYMREKEPEAAIDEYRKFLEIYPGHKYASYAQFQIGMIYFGQIEDYERGQDAASRALEEFEKLLALYPRNPYRESLKFYMQKCHEILADHAFMVGKFYFKKKAYRPAIERILDAIERYPDRNAEEAYYTLAVSFLRLGDRDEAQLYYGQLTEKYPEGELARKAKKEFDRSVRK